MLWWCDVVSFAPGEVLVALGPGAQADVRIRRAIEDIIPEQCRQWRHDVGEAAVRWAFQPDGDAAQQVLRLAARAALLACVPASRHDAEGLAGVDLDVLSDRR